MRTREKIFPCGGLPTTAHDARSGEEEEQEARQEEEKKKKRRFSIMLQCSAPP